jgi:hypothetical protein
MSKAMMDVNVMVCQIVGSRKARTDRVLATTKKLTILQTGLKTKKTAG